MGRPANLPLPMQAATAIFNRAGDCFSVFFQLVSHDRSIVAPIHEQMTAHFKNNFMQAANGGYILNDKGEPYFSVGTFGEGKAVSVMMGTAGSLERIFIFEDEPILYKAFRNQVEEIQTHANAILGMMYSNTPEGIVVPDRTLYLSPS